MVGFLVYMISYSILSYLDGLTQDKKGSWFWLLYAFNNHALIQGCKTIITWEEVGKTLTYLYTQSDEHAESIVI